MKFPAACGRECTLQYLPRLFPRQPTADLRALVGDYLFRKQFNVKTTNSIKNMKKGVVTLIIIIAVIVVIVMALVGAYNSMVTANEKVETAWAQVENVYQRRADLIPNLVNTVKGYASHESETLEAVVEARSKAMSVTVDPQNMTPEALAEFNQAQGQVGAALGRLMLLREAYPDLKANQNFLELQAQLEGTENRITVERQRFNEEARVYNTLIKRFPKNIIAGMFGFEIKPYFEASEGADRAPVVEF